MIKIMEYLIEDYVNKIKNLTKNLVAFLGSWQYYEKNIDTD